MVCVDSPVVGVAEVSDVWAEEDEVEELASPDWEGNAGGMAGDSG